LEPLPRHGVVWAQLQEVFECLAFFLFGFGISCQAEPDVGVAGNLAGEGTKHRSRLLVVARASGVHTEAQQVFNFGRADRCWHCRISVQQYAIIL
jgi:hypothetical protein